MYSVPELVPDLIDKKHKTELINCLEMQDWQAAFGSAYILTFSKNLQ